MIPGLANILVFILAAMSLGYFVCVKASKEQGILKGVGLVLGTIIIAVTLVLSIAIIRMGFVQQAGMPMMMRQQNPATTRPMMPAPHPAMPNK